MPELWATITKDFSFSAAHQLLGLPAEHQCSRLHGHNYVVRLEIYGVVGGQGFVIDYGELHPFGEWIDTVLDHRYLNDVWPDLNPTAELMAHKMVLAARACIEGLDNHVVAVSISETPKTWARVVDDPALEHLEFE